eukprot:356990-Chlamydomonas_euryale.AAC.1
MEWEAVRTASSKQCPANVQSRMIEGGVRGSVNGLMCQPSTALNSGSRHRTFNSTMLHNPPTALMCGPCAGRARRTPFVIFACRSSLASPGAPLCAAHAAPAASHACQLVLTRALRCRVHTRGTPRVPAGPH